MFGSQVQELAITLEEAKKKVKLGEALARLEKNKDFKLLIDEQYLREEPIRLVSNLSEYEFQKPEMQASLVSDMRAGASLQAFFRLIRTNANAAAQSVVDTEEQLAQARGNNEE